jgi:DNA repair photolyase
MKVVSRLLVVPERLCYNTARSLQFAVFQGDFQKTLLNRVLMMEKPVEWWVEDQIANGTWREVRLAPRITGLKQEITVLETERKSSFIKPWRMRREHHKTTFCPPIWYDLAIGSGPCGLQCRACFLMLTHRIRRDPRRHLIYNNYADMKRQVCRWLLDTKRRPSETLGLGIDCSDSLLYDLYTGISQWIVPLFGAPETNPKGCLLILLTKSTNVDQLEHLPHNGRVVVSFSLSPQSIADLWEGITPPMARRLEAGLKVQEWGYRYRWRLDPILTPPGWEDTYNEFFEQTFGDGHCPEYITLGTYREKSNQLLAWAARWGLPPMEWVPDELVESGSHRHVSERSRARIYEQMRKQIVWMWDDSVTVSVCKETHSIRKALGLCHAHCNCLK